MIEFRDVSKVYANGTEALHNVNLKIDKGEFVFIVGSSGAGKSTFLKMIMCEERPNSGEIIFDGTNIAAIRKGKIPFVRRKMGIVFQDFRLINHMTVYDNVAFAMRVVGASRKLIKKRVPYILSLVGLQHKAKHRPTELSGGERQRVGLARALVNNPSTIIADEPTGNIDPALSFEIVDLLNEINRRGTTILMVTHEHSLVKHFHKRIIQIHNGEVVADTSAIDGSVAAENTVETTESNVDEFVPEAALIEEITENNYVDEAVVSLDVEESVDSIVNDEKVIDEFEDFSTKSNGNVEKEISTNDNVDSNDESDFIGITDEEMKKFEEEPDKSSEFLFEAETVEEDRG